MVILYFIFFRPEFEKLSGSEMMETCYLVNELFIGPEEVEAMQSSWPQMSRCHICGIFHCFYGAIEIDSFKGATPLFLTLKK